MSGQSQGYVLGHSDQELARLSRQANFIDPPTRQFFREAGLSPGMRVLDVGSGAGHTAFIAAELVGATGEVIGTDRSLDAISKAQANADARGLRTVSFRHGNPAEMTFEHPFDAVVGRYVLLYLDQPSMLRRLVKHLRPGGVMVFQEPTMHFARSLPPVDLFERCRRWYMEGMHAGGAHIDTAYRMHSTFLAAGLPPPTMRMHTPIGGAPSIFEPLHDLANIVRTLLPALEQHGIATAAEVDIDTLAERLCHEVAASGSTIVGGAGIAAWSRV
jgi:2-polyprenyl-3-methyl-5-hydroxy-6-metoxy-1,4-benzoquinol methylase